MNGTRPMRPATVSVVLLVIWLAWGSLPMQAAIINVPADYTTIHGAIDAAGTGDVVVVAAGTYFLLYPNPDGTFSPSLRICMMRDGLEDYEYHVLLAQAAEKLRAAGRAQLAAECREAIKRGDAFILAYDNCLHVRPNFIYDSRRLLAEQIEKAQAALK